MSAVERPVKQRRQTDKTIQTQVVVQAELSGLFELTKTTSAREAPDAPMDAVAVVPSDLEQGGAASVAASSFTEGLPSHRMPQPVVGVIGQANVVLEEHGIPGSIGYYKRMAVRCPKTGVGHGDSYHPCVKRRNMGPRQTSLLGPREPEAYLSVWVHAADRFANREEHIAYRPTQEEVAAFAASQGWS